mmetsp:Transcript_68805/g.199619  ORF Transcript_68805/g.199619 Transcript_68805/m.199619 type:complete len:293 (+) Transcript_68805:99-977(+)
MRGRSRSVPCANRGLEASAVALDILEVVEGDARAIGARGVDAPVIADEVKVLDTLDAELNHAHLHVVVLAPTMPVQGLAPLVALREPLDRRHRVDLQRAIHFRALGRRALPQVAIRKVHGLALVGLDVGHQAVGKENRIRVDLGHEVVLVQQAGRGQAAPSDHEGLRVEEGVCRHAPLPQVTDLRGGRRVVPRVHHAVVAVAQRDLLAGDDSELIALENVGPLLERVLEEILLATVRPHDAEAEYGQELAQRRPGLVVLLMHGGARQTVGFFIMCCQIGEKREHGRIRELQR